MNYGIPQIKPVQLTPTTAWADFRQIAQSSGRPIHFYNTSKRKHLSARWSSRERDVKLLSAHPFIVPQVALLQSDDPLAYQISCRYSTMRLAEYYQWYGLTVVPAVQYTTAEHLPILLEGIPQRSTIAVEIQGPLTSWYAKVEQIIDVLDPTTLLVYGNNTLLSAVPWEVPTYTHTRFAEFTSVARRAVGEDPRTQYLLAHPSTIAYWIQRYRLERFSEDILQHVILESLRYPCAFDPEKSRINTYASNFASAVIRRYARNALQHPVVLGLTDCDTTGRYVAFDDSND